MHIVVCLEDCNGIMFNKRRISSDKILISKIIEMTQNKNLWVSEYSKELFVDKELRNTRLMTVYDISDLVKIENNDYFFIEDILPDNLERCSELIIFHWNRRYPSDVKFAYDLKDFTLVSSSDFKGFSHPEITEEYLKNINL